MAKKKKKGKNQLSFMNSMDNIPNQIGFIDSLNQVEKRVTKSEQEEKSETHNETEND